MVNYDVTTRRAELSYDLCETCGSLWLDAGELDKMAFQVDGSIEFCSEEEDKTPAKAGRKCPRCEDFGLSRAKFLGETNIVLEHCRNCGGFWLDGGELNLIDRELLKIMPVSGHGFSDFVNHVHVPFWSKRIKRQSGQTDFQVAVTPLKGAEHLGATKEECPVGGENLERYSIYGLEFEGCPKCHGMWLEKDELRKLKNKINDGQLHWLNAEIDRLEQMSVISSSRSCPKCRSQKLVSVLFPHSSVIIDWCPGCHGQWLDRGEFDSIIGYLRDEATSATPKEIRHELVQDLKAVVTGGPESRLAELGDAAAAVEALANAVIFEHPALFKFVTNSAAAGRTIGME
ncbi:MAG: zf-TFIIB domain-containing protein [Spartobacteria bacterium]